MLVLFGRERGRVENQYNSPNKTVVGSGQVVQITVGGQSVSGVLSYEKPVITTVYNKGTVSQGGPTR